MPVSRDMLVSELRDLLRLTAFEQTIATVRRAQAATTPIEQELAANARKSAERLALLNQSVRQVGGVPDVVGPLLGRVSAFVQAQVNQVQTLQGALLGDLALEHQLRERARYARTLAVSLGEMSVVPVLDRLDGAHTETIAWLELRLAEVGRSGSSALKATPVQNVVGAVRRVSGAPFNLAASGVNRLGGLVGRFTSRAPDALSTAVEQAADTARETRDSVIDLTQQTGEKAAQTAEQVAGQGGQVVSLAADRTSDAASAAGDAASAAGDAASSAASEAGDAVASAASQAGDAASSVGDAVSDAASTVAQTAEQAAETAEQVTHEVLEQSGGDDVKDDKAPFPGYERLSGDLVIRHVADTEDVDELRTLLAFEQAHKARKGVLSAAQERLSKLSSAGV